MKTIGYYWAVFCQKAHLRKKGSSPKLDFFKKQGVEIGENAKIYSNILTSEPYLIKIGDNVTISHSVTFVTHDNSVSKIFGYDRDVFGKIEIGNNCFIGARATIMYGVTLPDNTIVGAGSVVSKSPLESGCIVCGNPAKVVSTFEKLEEKIAPYVIHSGHLTAEERKKSYLKIRIN